MLKTNSIATSNRIKVLTVLLVLPLLALSILLTHILADAKLQIKSQFLDNQALHAGQTLVAIEENIRLLTRELFLLSRKQVIRTQNYIEAEEVIADAFNHVNSLLVNDIGLLDSNGIVQIPLKAPHLKGTDFSFRNYFIEAKKSTTSTAIYEFITFKGVDAGAKGVVVAMPTFDLLNKFSGVLLFTVKADELMKRFIPFKYTNSTTWVIDSDGTIIFHPAYPSGTLVNEIPSLNNSFQTFIDNLGTGEATRFEYLSLDGVESIAASHPLLIGGKRLSIIVSSPKKMVYSTVSHFTNQLVVSILLALFAMLCVTFAIIYLLRQGNKALQLEIIQRKRTEEQRLIYETRFKTLFNQASDSIFVMRLDRDEGLIIEDVNISACQTHGYCRDELLGKPISILDTPDMASQIKERVNKLLKDKTIFFEGKHVRKDGTIFPVEVSASIVNLEKNPYVLAIDRDVTERKQVEVKLKQHHDELEFLVEKRTETLNKTAELLQSEISERKRAENVLRTIAEGVSSTTGDAFFVSLVQYLAKMLGMDYAFVGKLTGEAKDTVQTLAVSGRGSIIENFKYSLEDTPCANVIDQGMCIYTENVQNLFSKDSLLVEIGVESYIGTLLRDVEGKAIGLLVVMDSSPAVASEVVTSMLQIFAARAAAEIERIEQEMELIKVRNLESLGRMAAGVAHEVNNPLTNASLNIQMLRKDLDFSTLEAPIQKRIVAIDRNVERASKIAKELLQFSLQREIIQELVDLNSIIESAFSQLTYPLEKITVCQNLLEHIEIFGDPLKLEGLFINIFNNAIEAMPCGGTLTITTTQGDGYLIAKVSDTGTGISDDHICKVFDPFFTTKDIGVDIDAGVGLGLSIVYGIVKQHNGTINVSSKEGKGTTFTVKFPLRFEV